MVLSFVFSYMNNQINVYQIHFVYLNDLYLFLIIVCIFSLQQHAELM